MVIDSGQKRLAMNVQLRPEVAPDQEFWSGFRQDSAFFFRAGSGRGVKNL